MAQSVARILGKDEVTGSNPVSSSTVPKTLRFRDFFVVCQSAADRILFSTVLRRDAVSYGTQNRDEFQK